METVHIVWYAVPNANGRVGGFLPMIEVNGKTKGSTWWASGYDLDAALEAAQAEADDEASRYVGDWEITVSRKQ